MRDTTIISGTAILLALLVTTDAVQAKIRTFTFQGSRDPVRTACKGEGRQLIEGKDHTICFTPTSGVVCYDDGVCNGSDPRTVGAWGLRSRDYQSAPSLVDSGGLSGGNGAASGAGSASTPNAPTPPIFN